MRTPAALVALLLTACDGGAGRAPSVDNKFLKLYCAAGLKPVGESVAKEYESVAGVRIEIQYGGSGTLLGNIIAARTGDLFLAADDSYLDAAAAKGLVRERIPMARMAPVVAVRRGNPKGVRSLDDLLRSDVAVALCHPEAAAIGKMTRRILENRNLWDGISGRAVVFKPTVTDVANDIRLGAVDAGFLWDATLAQYPDIEPAKDVSFPGEEMAVSIGVLSSCERPAAALRFARFLGAPDRGLAHFARAGYSVLDGDPWEDSPEILLYSGAMLRPGLERAVEAFRAREGVRVNTVYNGCGLLVAQMKAGGSPDGYFACDATFFEPVKEKFFDPRPLTENDLVIAVQDGNPKKIAGLKDLAIPGLRVGLAHPDKSALGVLSRRVLEREGLRAAVEANLSVDSPTGDFLVNQLRVRALDAAIVYRSNVLSASDGSLRPLDIVSLGAATTSAAQPFARAKGVRHARLLERFFDTVLSAESRAGFEAQGFTWRAQP